MKIDYRVRERGVEIVRCFGADSCVYLPGQIRGIPVTGIAAVSYTHLDVYKRQVRGAGYMLKEKE